MHTTFCGLQKLSENLPFLQVGELLGHRTSDMTKRYTHLSLQYKKDGVDALCRRLCGTATKVPQQMAK